MTYRVIFDAKISIQDAEVVFDFTGESYKKGIELIFLKPDHTLPLATVDPEKMRVVFQNLIENAIKFTPARGTVTVTVAEVEPEKVAASAAAPEKKPPTTMSQHWGLTLSDLTDAQKKELDKYDAGSH